MEPAALAAPGGGEGITFRKAVKYAAKGRVALIGPAGSGKSYTMLLLARALAGPKGKIAAVDTEHGSLSKYADIFDFDVMELDSFSPETFVNALHASEAAGYDVFCCDSLSHFWVGKDGALEFVDMAAKRNRDNMGGWKEFRPHERLMVDEMISSTMPRDLHHAYQDRLPGADWLGRQEEAREGRPGAGAARRAGVRVRPRRIHGRGQYLYRG